ncbi:MAG: hypothetical protein KAU95_03230 [Candidatus Aenigmarchaeota archaeon]|nr:hypothetical protein [Candidatus Aenigmarchaeota archaeon]
MSGNKLKGLAIDKETIVAFVLIIIISVIVIAFLLKAQKGTEDIYTDMDLRAECAKWLTEEPPCLGEIERYPALNATFDGDADKARESCGCPN